MSYKWLLLGIFLIGCGDESVNPTTLTLTIENPPELKIVEVEKTYDSEIDKVYSELKEHMTPYEYRFLLQEVKRHCTENLTETHILHRLKDELTPAVYELLLEPSRIPKWTLTDTSRIKLAAHLKNATAITRYTGKVIYLFDFQSTIVVRQSKACCPDTYWVDSEVYFGKRTFNRALYDLIVEIDELNYQEDLSAVLEEAPPIKLPDISEDLDISIVVLDESNNLIPPTSEWYYDWVFDYEDAPRATNEEVEKANYAETPLAYDCIED